MKIRHNLSKKISLEHQRTKLITKSIVTAILMAGFIFSCGGTIPEPIKTPITGSFSYDPNMFITAYGSPVNSGVPTWVEESSNQTVSYSLSPATAGISVDPSTGVVSISEVANAMVSTTFTVTASGTGSYTGRITTTIDIEITTIATSGSFAYIPNIIRAPSGSTTSSPSPAWTGVISNQTVSYSLSPPTVGISINPSTGVVSISEDANAMTNTRFTVTAIGTGNYVGTNTATIDIAVLAQITGSFSYTPNTLSTVSGNATNSIAPIWTGAASGQTVSYSLSPSTVGISIATFTGVVSISATLNGMTNTRFTVTASGIGDYAGTKTAAINISIVGVIRSLAEHSGDVKSVAWSPDGSQLASGSYNGNIKIWRMSDWSNTQTLTGHTTPVQSVAWNLDGTHLASGSHDSTIKIWRVSDGANTQTLTGHIRSVESVAWSPDASHIASGSGDNTIIVWRVSDGTLITNLSEHGGSVESVAWSPDGTHLASGSYDRSIKIWEVSSWSDTQTLTGHTHSVRSVAWSTNGSHVVSGSDDRSIKMWRVSDGINTQTLTNHTSWVRSVVWSPDGSQLASGSYDNTIKIWRVSDGTNTQTLTNHTDDVNSVAWSSDGTRLASGSSDNTIKIWFMGR